MTEKEMCIELKDKCVKDNPFDVMLYQSLELARDFLFACHRLNNPEVSKQVCVDLKRLQSRVDIITTEFEKVDGMSKETTSMCRETSFYYDSERFEKLNKSLLQFERNMETIWTRCNPNRNDTFERIRLGLQSEEYKRLLILRNLMDTSEDLSNVDSDFLYTLVDVIERPDECIEHKWITENELKQKQKIIDKYMLTVEDVNYMIAYKFKN